jgi:chromosome partitioning protein
VGKTTTAVNLAASLAATRRRVLLIDLDPQGNATTGSGINKATLARGTLEVLLGECTAAEAIQQLATPGMSLLPANQDLTAAEVRLLELGPGRELRLRDALAPVRERYDVIFIDCPPSLNILTVNALVAADSVLIPMQCEYYALEGLSALWHIEQIARQSPCTEGILRTMYDPRNNLATEVSAQLLTTGDRCSTVVPRNVRCRGAVVRLRLQHDRDSRGAWPIWRWPENVRARDDAWSPRHAQHRRTTLGRACRCSGRRPARRLAQAEDAPRPPGDGWPAAADLLRGANISRASTCGRKPSPSWPTRSAPRAWCSPSWSGRSAHPRPVPSNATRSSPASAAGAPPSRRV